MERDGAHALPPGLRQRLRGVLFDLDGVLIDSGPAWHRVLGELADRHGYPRPSWEAFQSTFGQGPEGDQRQFFPGLPVDTINAYYDEAFPRQLDHVSVTPGAVDALETLGARGLKLACVTNTPRDLAERVLDETGLLPRLDTFAAAGEGAEKPEPDLLHLALRRLALQASEVVYLGDSDCDVGAAGAAGVFFVGVGIAGAVELGSVAELPGVLAG